MKGKFNYNILECMDCKSKISKAIHYSRDLTLCFDCYDLHKKQEVTCYNCKFYDGYLCDLNYRSMAILDESKTAKECEHFTHGEFVDSDENLIVNIK